MDAVLTAILDAGIRSIIDLMELEEIEDHEDGEQYPHYEDRMEALAEQRGAIVEIQRHPIIAAAPPPLQELELIVDALDNEITGRNSPTLVHCSDGHGRTGMIVGCYLARHGVASGEDVLTKIRDLRAFDPTLADQKSLDNIVQERIVTRWKEGQ
jgi:protein tyrosine phosphatase